ncbi:PREDICTED: MDS1 and EVI1 complex locus protein EVI1-like [Nicrophorus vespilloides]|uniref:MDS1 and EVI1 complex locus protein EVI1-like n=1 Tax=Nicrophorus vespilloides TaxID=110193 RepID=A0ABM1M540_NICVS|nr:PREDICTED: MDS1 and EVI1 complex locus protein EVI1-like [Nicrophorus vespilloides]
MFRTPKRTKLQLNASEVTPPNRIFKMKTPDSSPANGSLVGVSPTSLSALSPSETRRGRPRAEELNSLILQGSTSPSSIKCTYCNRVFPREKSLQAHLRTHTGEKPYACDYPRCTKRFAQSGQLKTHQRLHTGEKPFICAAPNCERRFTHANRHCPEHPEGTLKRFSYTSNMSIENIDDEQYKKDIQKWIDTVKKSDTKSNSTCSTPKKSRFNDTWHYKNFDLEHSENINPNTQLAKIIKVRSSQELTYGFHKKELDAANSTPTQVLNDDFKSQKVPYVAEEVEVETSPVMSCTRYTELPKKRWLREALDQQRWDNEANQDLALPINWGEDSSLIEYENQKRPTVLVKIGNGDKKDISSSDMQIAMALVELSNIQPNNSANYTY